MRRSDAAREAPVPTGGRTLAARWQGRAPSAPSESESEGSAAQPAARAPTAPGGVEASARRSVLVVLGALMLGMFLAALDQTIVATALPTIAGDLGGLAHLSWVVTAYMLTSTVSTPLWGKLGDLYGRKRLFEVAIASFVVGSALSGLSHDMNELIAFRAFQGIGAGGLIVGAQAITGDLVSPRERGRYMGYFGAVFGVSSIAGPLLGGYFTEHLSWRWVFYINVPIGVVALGAVASLLHLPRRRTEHAVDYLGTTLLGTAVTAIILLTTWGGTTYPWLSTPIVSLAIGALALLAAFVAVEHRAREPVLPLELFADRVFTVASAIGFIVGFALFGSVVFLPLYLQTVFGASPTASGLELMPVMAGMLAMSITSGRLISRFGRYKAYPVAGTAILAVGLWLLSLMDAHTSLAEVSAFMLVIGVGIGLVMQVLVIVVQNAVPYRHLGTATSLATFFRAIGGSFGVAVFGAVFDNRLAANLPKYLPAPLARRLAHGTLTGNPAQLEHLPFEIHHGFVLAFASSLHVVFLSAVPIALVGFGLTWLLAEVPLREHAFLVPSADGEGALRFEAVGGLADAALSGDGDQQARPAPDRGPAGVAHERGAAPCAGS
jgi:EmrB/QacA subfamily drug resistance transporter